jgi:hypothetical protein
VGFEPTREDITYLRTRGYCDRHCLHIQDINYPEDGAVCFWKFFVSAYWDIQCYTYNPEDHSLSLHRHENIRIQVLVYGYFFPNTG